MDEPREQLAVLILDSLDGKWFAPDYARRFDEREFAYFRIRVSRGAQRQEARRSWRHWTSCHIVGRY